MVYGTVISIFEKITQSSVSILKFRLIDNFGKSITKIKKNYIKKKTL